MYLVVYIRFVVNRVAFYVPLLEEPHFPALAPSSRKISRLSENPFWDYPDLGSRMAQAARREAVERDEIRKLSLCELFGRTFCALSWHIGAHFNPTDHKAFAASTNSFFSRSSRLISKIQSISDRRLLQRPKCLPTPNTEQSSMPNNSQNDNHNTGCAEIVPRPTTT
jgi:hypothetical protein